MVEVRSKRRNRGILRNPKFHIWRHVLNLGLQGLHPSLEKLSSSHSRSPLAAGHSHLIDFISLLPTTMATLVRVQKPQKPIVSLHSPSSTDWQAALEAPVPAPFPTDFLRGERDQQELLDDLAGEELEFDGITERRREGQTKDGHADGFEEQPQPHAVENTDTVRGSGLLST